MSDKRDETDQAASVVGEASSVGDRSSADAPKEPSLGPAFLVVGILSLAGLCSFCAFGSWFLFADQYPLAIRGIQKQLIPWVEQSRLAPEDKSQITQSLQALIPPLEARELDSRQLSRLHFCLQDNPVLLWGTVQSIEAQASAVGLTETELQTLDRVTDRLLKAAVDRKLSRNDLEFAIEPCLDNEQDGQGPRIAPSLSADQIRQFMTRGEQLANQNQIANEPYGKTAGEAFSILIDKALTVE